MMESTNPKIKKGNSKQVLITSVKQLSELLLGFGLIAVGVGFLAVSYLLPEIREYFILGGLLWFILGGTTIIIDVVVDHKKEKLGRVELE